MDKNDELLDELNDSGLVPCESHSISQPSSELNLYSSFIGNIDKKVYFFRELTQTKCLYTPEEAKQYMDNLKVHLNHISPQLSFGKNADSLPIINCTDIINESDIKKRKSLNILLTGEKQSGKSTFMGKIISRLQKETRFKYSFHPSDSYSTKRISITYSDNMQANITLIEGEGFNLFKENDCQAYIQALKHELHNRNKDHSKKTYYNQKLGEDNRIHIILFFLKECQNYNKTVLTAIKLLSQWVNIVPIISKKEKPMNAIDDDFDFFKSKEAFRQILMLNHITILDITKEYISRTNKGKEEEEEEYSDLSAPFEILLHPPKVVHNNKSNNNNNASTRGDFPKVYYLIFHFYPFSIYKNQFYSKFKENMAKISMKADNVIIEKNIFFGFMDKKRQQEVRIDQMENQFNGPNSSPLSTLSIFDRLSEIEDAMEVYINTLREYKSTALKIDIKYKSLIKEIDDLIISLKSEIDEKLEVIVNEIEHQKTALFGTALKNRDAIKVILKDNRELNKQIAYCNYKLVNMEKELHIK